MRPITETLKEGQAVAGANITTLNNTAVLTSALDMSQVRRARAFLHCGTLSGSASVNFALYASATLNGVYTAITMPTTQVAITGITTDDSWNALEIRADQMPAGTRFLKARAVETASANAVVDVFIIGDCGSYSPNSDNDTVTWTNNIVGA